MIIKKIGDRLTVICSKNQLVLRVWREAGHIQPTQPSLSQLADGDSCLQPYKKVKNVKEACDPLPQSLSRPLFPGLSPFYNHQEVQQTQPSVPIPISHRAT